MKLLYPTSLELDPEAFALPNVEVFPYDVTTFLPTAHEDAEVLVTWGNSAKMLRDAAARMAQLQWIQSLAAGPNDVLKAGFPASVRITSGSGLHDHTVAEHTLGLLLVAARRFHEMRDAQRQRRWPGHLGGLQPDRPKGAFRTLQGAKVLVWGFGSIGQRLAPLLAMLGANVKGVARSAGERLGFPVVTADALPELLPETDALVMILPSNPETHHALSAALLARLPHHAWVVNVGRGDTLDEGALITALEQGRLGGAALDVFETEPLPESSPLWGFDNVIISPHAAGGRPQGAEALIRENVVRFLAGRPLKNLVAR
jgi:phosphoglycerate dehydrogenase-like enzyme